MKTELARIARVCAILAVAGMSTACATVTRGANQAWTVETTPGGAQVKTDIGFACDATPCTFKMPRKSEFNVTITKEGYKAYTTHVTHQMSGQGGTAVAGNVLIGGLIGIGVDAATGAGLDLKPNPLTVVLEPEGDIAAAPAADAPAAP